MLPILLLIIPRVLSAEITVEKDPTALVACDRQQATLDTTILLSPMLSHIQSPLLLRWNQDDLRTFDPCLVLPPACVKYLLEHNVQIAPEGSATSECKSIMDLRVINQGFKLNSALVAKLQTPENGNYRLGMSALYTGSLAPDYLLKVTKDAATSLTDVVTELSESDDVVLPYPAIDVGENSCPFNSEFCSALLAMEATQSDGLVISDSSKVGRLTGKIMCSSRTVSNPKRRLTTASLQMYLTDENGNTLWEGSFNASGEDGNTNTRIRHLEALIASTQSNALLFGGLGIPLATVGVFVWNDNYNARIRKLGEGRIPSSSGLESSLSAGEYVGIGLSCIGTLGTAFGIHQAFSAARYDGERNKLLREGVVPNTNGSSGNQ